MFSFTSLRLDNVCSLKSKRSATISFRAPSLLVRVFKSPELPEVTPLLLCSFNWASAPVPNAVETVNVCGSTASKFVLIAQVHAKTEVRCNRIMAKWRLSRNWLMSDTTNPPREIQSWLYLTQTPRFPRQFRARHRRSRGRGASRSCRDAYRGAD